MGFFADGRAGTDLANLVRVCSLLVRLCAAAGCAPHFGTITNNLALLCVRVCAHCAVGLVLLDEVHLLNEAGRGSSLEAGCVCRIKAVAAFPELSKAHIAAVRFVAVSATIPNIGDVSGGGCRLCAPVRGCCMQQPWLSCASFQLCSSLAGPL